MSFPTLMKTERLCKYFLSYVRVPCQPYFDTTGNQVSHWVQLKTVFMSCMCHMQWLIWHNTIWKTAVYRNVLLWWFTAFVVTSVRRKKIKHPWEEDHRRHDWVTMLRKCVCKCSKGEVWPSALNPTDSVCGVSPGMILDYGCNNFRHPLGNMLIAQIGNFFTLHTAGPRRISQTLSAFQALIIGFSYWIWCSAPAARIPNLEFLEPGWFAQGHKCIG